MKSAFCVLGMLLGFACAASAREVRQPLPPRRPPIVARTNAVLKARGARLAAQQLGPACIDVLIAYDRPATLWADWKGNGLTNFAAAAVARMNAALTNSQMQAALVFRLAGVTTVEANGGGDFDGVLDAVTDGTGAWREVRQARERVGADIAMTLIDTGSAYGVTGLSWALDTEDYDGYVDYAYGVCSIRSVAESHTLTHEVGHVLGAGHGDRQAADPGPLLFPYSSGYYFTTNDTPCHTIMAYDSDGYGNYYEEAPYFSTPEVILDGVAVGTALNDNARTLRETAAHVAQYAEPLWYDYSISFSGAAEDIPCCMRGKVYALPSSATGGKPAGWLRQDTGRRYDPGVLVFDLGTGGEKIVLTPVWE